MSRAAVHRVGVGAAAILAVAIMALGAAAATTGSPARARGAPVATTSVLCTGVHGVGAGETCVSLARAAHLTLPQFMGLNPNIACAALFPGQWVCVRGAAIG